MLRDILSIPATSELRQEIPAIFSIAENLEPLVTEYRQLTTEQEDSLTVGGAMNGDDRWSEFWVKVQDQLITLGDVLSGSGEDIEEKKREDAFWEIITSMVAEENKEKSRGRRR